MSLLTATERADLLAEFTEAQPDTSLTLYRPQGDGSYTTIAAQEVQVSYASRRQTQRAGGTGIDEVLADVTFYREAPFNVRIRDEFVLDGQPGGEIIRVTTDPVLGVIQADGVYGTARRS